MTLPAGCCAPDCPRRQFEPKELPTRSDPTLGYMPGPDGKAFHFVCYWRMLREAACSAVASSAPPG